MSTNSKSSRRSVGRGRGAGWMAVLVLAVGMFRVPSQEIATVLQLTGTPVGGGGRSAGGAFVLTGGVPQPAGGLASALGEPGMVGGDFRLLSGLIGSVPSAPRLRAVLTADKAAELTWDVAGTGFILEFSSELGPGAVWRPLEPQPTGNSFLTPCAQPARYFRLRQP